MTTRLVPHLWFDKEAKDAAAFYAEAFPDGRVTYEQTITDTPAGDCDIVAFELAGQPFMAISAGPMFKINPSISFIVNFDPSQDPDAATKLDALWAKLADGGFVMMGLGEYPFSKRYGWVADKFGVSWQLMLTDPAGEPRPFITPSLLYVGDNAGRAAEARKHYVSLFDDGKEGILVPYGPGDPHSKEGTVMFSDAYLAGAWIALMDNGFPHQFPFNEAVSLLIECDTQEEIDHLWDKLSAVPEAEQCGWVKDAFGVSWQIVPKSLNEFMRTGSPEQVVAVTQAFLKMKKFDVKALEEAFASAVVH